MLLKGEGEAADMLGGRGFSQYLQPIFTGISVPHVSPEQIKGFKVPLPPSGEQGRILETIADQSRSMDAEKFQGQCEIDLLREYRTRLIADLVTGKLDVRAAAAKLPDETDTDEPDLEDPEDTPDEDAEPTDDEEAAE